MAWWPLEAANPAELEERLALGGHLLPLPREPAALANVLEVSIVNFLTLRVLGVAGAQIHRGTERGYPDFEVAGPAFGRRRLPRGRCEGGPAGAKRETDSEQDHAVHRQHVLQVAEPALAGNLPAVQRLRQSS